MSKQAILQLCILSFVLGTASGLYFEKKYMDSVKLKEVNTQHKIEQAQDEAVQKVADKVLTGISEWKQNTRDVVKEMHYEKVKPVFLNDCATDNYIGMFNSRQDYARKTLAGEPQTAVSH